MHPLYDTTLLYHQPDHLTPPDAAERIARAQIAPQRFKLTVWISDTIRAAFGHPVVNRKA